MLRREVPCIALSRINARIKMEAQRILNHQSSLRLMLVNEVLLEGHQLTRGRHGEHFRLVHNWNAIAYLCLGATCCQGVLDSLAVAARKRLPFVMDGRRLLVSADDPALRRDDAH